MTPPLVPAPLLCECGHLLKDHPIRAACRICPCTRYVERDPFACLCGHVHRPGMARVGDVAPDRTFSMSNNHRAYYVRLLEHLYPGVVGFFDKQKTSEAENDRERWLPIAVRITREAQS